MCFAGVVVAVWEERGSLSFFWSFVGSSGIAGGKSSPTSRRQHAWKKMLEAVCGTGWCNSSVSLPSWLVVDEVSVTSPVNSVYTRVTFFEVLVLSSPYE